MWPDKRSNRARDRLEPHLGRAGTAALFGRFRSRHRQHRPHSRVRGPPGAACLDAEAGRGRRRATNTAPSRMLKRGLMSGIVSAGVHVADLSQAPLPIGRFHTPARQAAGGYVRVSPFDVRVCDVKFFDRQALDMDKIRSEGRRSSSARIVASFARRCRPDLRNPACRRTVQRGIPRRVARRGDRGGEAESSSTLARDTRAVPPSTDTLGVEAVAVNGSCPNIGRVRSRSSRRSSASSRYSFPLSERRSA